MLPTLRAGPNIREGPYIGLGMEMAARIIQALQGSVGTATSTAENPESLETTVHKILHRASLGTERKICYHCGKTGHFPNQCCFKHAYCHACGKKGYIAPVCKSAHSGKSSLTQVHKKPSRKKLKGNCNAFLDLFVLYIF